MKRILTFSAFVVSALSLASCRSPQPPPPQVVEYHHYHTNTRYVNKPTSVSDYPKSAGVSSSSPEGFQAVTPPSTYSR